MKTSKGTDSASDAGSTNRANDKQKITILKKAVLELREQKLQLERSNSSLSEQLSLLQQEKQDNEIKFKQQIEELTQQLSQTLQPQNQQQVTRIQSQSMFSTQRFGIGRGENSEDQSQSVQQLQKQLKQLQNEMKIQNNNHEAQMTVLQTVYKELERDYQKKETIETKQCKDLEEKNLMITQLKQNIEDIERELYTRLKDHQTTIVQLQLKLKTMEKELEQKEEESKDLEKKLDDQRFKVAQYQSELDETRGKFIQYKLILKKEILSFDCLLILRQNIYNQYILELETAGQKFIYNACEVSDLKPMDDSSFTIKIKSNKVREELFQTTQDVKKICKSIKHFLQKAQKEQLKLPNQQPQQNQGLLSGLMALFSSSNNNSMQGSNISNNNNNNDTDSQKDTNKDKDQLKIIVNGNDFQK